MAAGHTSETLYFFKTYQTYTQSDKISIIPTGPPRFVTKTPSLVSVREGENLSLEISVSGYPAPKITWSLHGRNYEDKSRFNITGEIFQISGSASKIRE